MVDQYVKSDGDTAEVLVAAAANRVNLWLDQEGDLIELDPKQMRELIVVFQNFLAMP